MDCAELQGDELLALLVAETEMHRFLPSPRFMNIFVSRQSKASEGSRDQAELEYSATTKQAALKATEYMDVLDDGMRT